MKSQNKKTIISLFIIVAFVAAIYFVLRLNAQQDLLQTEPQVSNEQSFTEEKGNVASNQVEEKSSESFGEQFPQLEGVGMGIWPYGIGENLTWKGEFYAKNMPSMSQFYHENTDPNSEYYFLISLIDEYPGDTVYDTLKVADSYISQACSNNALVASVTYDGMAVKKVNRAWGVDFEQKKFYEIKDVSTITCADKGWGDGL